MILAPLTGMALVVSVATGPVDIANPTASHLSTREKSAALQPLVHHATECIAARVAADPRYRGPTPSLGDIIVESIPSCVEAVRAMIDAHDRYFGEGTGEAFFMGPYLDVLPAAVTRQKAPSARGDAAHESGATIRP